MQIKRWMVVAGALALVAAGVGGYAAFAARGAAAKKADDAAAASNVVLSLSAADVATAGPATLTQSLAVAGTVDAARQAVVRSRHAGFLGHVSKRAGDRVQAGERLAVVDSEELRLRIAEREAALKQAQAALTVAESNRTQQRSLADRGFISKAALDSTESAFVGAGAELFWIDRYEASLWQNADATGSVYGTASNNYPPTFPADGTYGTPL